MVIADDLATMTISDLDLGRYVAVGPSESVSSTVQAMRQAAYSCACVVDDDRLVGVFTERDVVMRVVDRSRVCDLRSTRRCTGQFERCERPTGQAFTPDSPTLTQLHSLVNDPTVGWFATAVLTRGYPVEQELATLEIAEELVIAGS